MSKQIPIERKFPFVAVGMSVLWHAEGCPEYPGCPAIVMGVGHMALDLAILEPAYDRFIRKDGVRWNHEPSVPSAVRMDTGGWDFTQNEHRLRAEFDELSEWPEAREARIAARTPPMIPAGADGKSAA